MPVTPGCYASPLNDCDGGPLTREHFISEMLLEQFGKRFVITGPGWATEPKWVSPGSLAPRVLCERHNGALSPLDTAMGALYRVIRRALDGGVGGRHECDGELLERWAIKVMLGAVASGNMLGDTGKAMPIPMQHLRVLFGHEPVSDGSGFFYIGDRVEGLDADLLNVMLNFNPKGHPEEDKIIGVTIRVPGFQFITTVNTPIEVAKQRVVHRPDGFLFGDPERARVALRWNGQQGSARVLQLRLN